MDAEYLFGRITRENANGELEEQNMLRVKSKEEINLPLKTYLEHMVKSDDMIVTYDFKIEEEIKRDTDMEGNNYVWYIVPECHCVIDRSPAAEAAVFEAEGKLDYIAMMADIDIPTEDEEEMMEDSAAMSSPMSSPTGMDDGPMFDGQAEEPVVHSPKYEKVLTYYEAGIWNKKMVENAVGKWITKAEAAEIFGTEPLDVE